MRTVSPNVPNLIHPNVTYLDGAVTPTAAKTGIAGILTGLAAAEERLEGAIDALERAPGDCGVDGSELMRLVRPDAGERAALILVGDALPAHAPRIATFLQSGIAEIAEPAQDLVEQEVAGPGAVTPKVVGPGSHDRMLPRESDRTDHSNI